MSHHVLGAIHDMQSRALEAEKKHFYLVSYVSYPRGRPPEDQVRPYFNNIVVEGSPVEWLKRARKREGSQHVLLNWWEISAQDAEELRQVDVTMLIKSTTGYV